MRVFFTGATGVIGSQAVPLLLDEGHEVAAVSRSNGDRAWLESAGAAPVVVDLFDADAVREATKGAEAVVHFATSIPPMAEMGKRDAWMTNDRLRTTGTQNLVDAAIANGSAVFIQESLTLIYADGADRWLDEDSPIDPPWTVVDSILDAERHVAHFVAAGGRGVSLRLGSLYGPGRASRELIAATADRKMPVVGRGDNYVSSLHSHDAATAVAAALSIPSGAYNVVDDEPVTAAVRQDALAAVLGARRPRRVPAWLARAAAKDAVSIMTVSQRVSNRRFREVSDWKPLHRSVVDGWRDVVSSPAGVK